VNERLYRSRDERMLAGVAGGVAERFDLDPSLVRVLWVVLVFVSGGLFLLLYIAMALVVPEAPGGADRWAAWGSQNAPGPGAVPGWGSTGAAAGSTTGSTSGGAAGPPADAQAFASATPPVSDGPAGSEPPAGSDTPPAGAGPTPPPASWGGPWPGYRPHERHRGSGRGAVIAGIILVLVGGYLLLRAAIPQVDLGAFWPLVLVGVGIALLVGSIRPGSGGHPVD
jgi:phage shock protein C